MVDRSEPHARGGQARVSIADRSAAGKDLAVRASRGDVEAFSQLVRTHSDLVYRVALRILGAEDAQDASQEVWIQVWRKLKNFRGESEFSTWLYRITVNTCLSAYRKETRRESRELWEEFPQLPETTAGEADPETSALDQERREEIGEALQHVRDEHRTAMVLRHMEGLSYGEIAEILEVPRGTAKGWASRGRAELLAVLVEKGYARRTTGREEEDE
jgi:RNA polymerase sigma-70 factor (ECF subfamily)